MSAQSRPTATPDHDGIEGDDRPFGIAALDAVAAYQRSASPEAAAAFEAAVRDMVKSEIGRRLRERPPGPLTSPLDR